MVNSFVLLSILCLLSCGLEDVLYLDYIDDTDVIMTDNTAASIRLPQASAEGYSSYFLNFVIFYRIYISGEPFSGLIDSSNRSQISSSLNSDFQGLYGMTDKTSTSFNSASVEKAFTDRKFFRLTLENNSIDTVLGRSSLGNTMDISFSPVNGERPVFTLNGVSYTLQRAVSGPSLEFRPEPDRYFLNHPDLYNTAKATNEINADVATNTRTDVELKYTYVSMYIFALGREYHLTTVYSQPTHIGTFRLAEAF